MIPTATRYRFVALAIFGSVLAGCGSGSGIDQPPRRPTDPSAFWNSATVYFLLTDRFENGDPANDLARGRPQDGAVLRNIMGGDLRGVLRRIESGYFTDLGVDAIWMTPFVEQIVGGVDEGTGRTYAFHGYWARDWTAVEPALGGIDDLRAVVDAAHRRGIRVLMDAVINHTGPVTPLDPQWPDSWVRTTPRCAYQDYASTVDCTLVENLPDIRTDRDDPVDLPPTLTEKWEREGRLEQETAELDAFFARTGYPRAPRYYLVKWLTDWVRELGIDGWRMDTAKHIEESVSLELKREAERAFADWKAAHPDKVLDDLPFYLMGEVYNYEIDHGREFDFGDRRVDFFAHGYDGLINFDFRVRHPGSLDDLYDRYATTLRDGALRGVAVLNYISSHDDGSPYDLEREEPLAAGTRLLLAPGGAQIYYGDELARPLRVDGAQGDANLRSFMNWDDLAAGGVTAEVLDHWRRLGRFRRAHPAVGAGAHTMHEADPYVFSRVLVVDGQVDRVLIALGVPAGSKRVPVFGVFENGTGLVDEYSGATGTVRNGSVELASDGTIVLLAELP